MPPNTGERREALLSVPATLVHAMEFCPCREHVTACHNQASIWNMRWYCVQCVLHSTRQQRVQIIVLCCHAARNRRTAWLHQFAEQFNVHPMTTRFLHEQVFPEDEDAEIWKLRSSGMVGCHQNFQISKDVMFWLQACLPR